MLDHANTIEPSPEAEADALGLIAEYWQTDSHGRQDSIGVALESSERHEAQPSDLEVHTWETCPSTGARALARFTP